MEAAQSAQQDARRDALRRIGEELVNAIRERRAAAIFVRCEGEATKNDAVEAITGATDRLEWVVVRLQGGAEPLQPLLDIAGNPRAVAVVETCSAEARQRLAVAWPHFERRGMRIVTLVEPGEVRAFAREGGDFWKRRDLFTQWPAHPDDRKSEGPPTRGLPDEPHGDEIPPLWRAIRNRIASILHMESGPTRGRALLRAALDAFRASDLDTAADYGIQAVQDLRAEGTPVEFAQAFQMLGAVAEHRGDLDQAEDWYREALQFWQESGERQGLAGIYSRLGALRFLKGDLERAGHLLGQALELEESLGDPIRLCDAYRHMGMFREREGNFEDAEVYYARAEELAKDHNDEVRLSRVLHHRGRLAERDGRFEEALKHYEESLALKQRFRDLRGMAATLHQMGNVHLQQGHHEEALRAYAQAARYERLINDRVGLASTLVQLAYVAEERFRFAEAYEALMEAEPILRKLHSPLVPEVKERISRIRPMVGEEDRKRVDALARGGFQRTEEAREGAFPEDVAGGGAAQPSSAGPEEEPEATRAGAPPAAAPLPPQDQFLEATLDYEVPPATPDVASAGEGAQPASSPGQTTAPGLEGPSDVEDELAAFRRFLDEEGGG